MDRLRTIKAKKHSKNLNDDKAFDKMQSDYEDEINLAEGKTVPTITPGKPGLDGIIRILLK